jgi:hypothetical protein
MRLLLPVFFCLSGCGGGEVDEPTPVESEPVVEVQEAGPTAEEVIKGVVGGSLGMPEEVSANITVELSPNTGGIAVAREPLAGLCVALYIDDGTWLTLHKTTDPADEVISSLAMALPAPNMGGIADRAELEFMFQRCLTAGGVHE